MPAQVNAGSNTDSFITGYSRNGPRPVRHLRVEAEGSVAKIYKFGNVIGQGMFGTVFEVRDMKDKKLWASKVIVKNNVSQTAMKALEREISILKVLDHPHIILLREVLESRTKIYLIIEKCQSDLQRLIDEHRSFSENEVKRIIHDLGSAVTYIHKRDIVHRDIKLENVLVTDNPSDSADHLYIKLSDFGLSIVKSRRGIDGMLHDKCGTLVYMAPEVLTTGSYSQQCDVWSVGIIMYFLISRTLPFIGQLQDEVVNRICNVEPNFDGLDVSLEAKDLLRCLLNKDPAERITAAEMSFHPWLRNQKMIDSAQSHNVIDLMRLCKQDMRVSADSESTNNEAFMGVSNGRSQASVTVQNVKFDKEKDKGKNVSPLSYVNDVTSSHGTSVGRGSKPPSKTSARGSKHIPKKTVTKKK